MARVFISVFKKNNGLEFSSLIRRNTQHVFIHSLLRRLLCSIGPRWPRWDDYRHKTEELRYFWPYGESGQNTRSTRGWVSAQDQRGRWTNHPSTFGTWKVMGSKGTGTKHVLDTQKLACIAIGTSAQWILHLAGIDLSLEYIVEENQQIVGWSIFKRRTRLNHPEIFLD